MRCVPSLLFALLTAAPLAAQSARVVPYPIDLPPEFVAAIDKGTRTEVGAPGSKYWTNYARYKIDAELDPAAARVTARAEMTYQNRSPDELDSLQIHLRQNLHRAGAMRTRYVEVTDGVEVTAIEIDGKKLRRTPRVRDTRLRLRLPEELEPGEETTVTIEWTFPVPTAGRAPRNGHEDEDVFYLAYWYPQFAVYDDVEGWVFDLYRGNGEFYMDYADYDFSWTVPEGYLVRATGELQNPDEVLTEKARAALAEARTNHDVVSIVDEDDLEGGALTAKAGESGKLTWRYRAENVRDLAVSIARTYVWDATHAVVPGRDDPVMIHAVYEPGAGRWDRAAEAAQHTIEYMSKMVFPYPWPHMTACEGIIGGGMEFPMMTICGERTSSGTIAHELIHMWFPMIVGSNEKRYAWQDEGFTSFWTALCRDDATGGDNGPKRGIAGYIGSVRRGGDAACMKHGDSYVMQSFGFASYSKTAAILHQLRGMLGDDVFFAAFRTYVSDWAFKHPYPYDFFRSFQTTAGQDLEPFFRTWFYETWTLDHAVASVEQSATGAVIVIEDRSRAVHPATVLITLADGSTRREQIPAEHWWRSRTMELKVDGAVARVELDPDLVTLDIDRDNNRWLPAGEGGDDDGDGADKDK